MPPAGRLRRWRAGAVRRWRRLPGNVRGSLWLLIASVFFSVMAATIKYVGQRLPVIEILCFRQIILLLILSPAILREGPGLFRTGNLRLHLARFALSLIATLCVFHALVHLPLAEATAIGFTRGLFTTLLAVLILRELVGVRRWTATILGFIGVIIVVRPGPEGVNEWALVSLGAALVVAFIMIINRILAQTDRPVQIMAYSAVLLSIAYAGPTWYFWQTPTLTEMALILTIGAVAAVGQYCNLRGFRVGEAAAIAPMDYSRLLFAVLIGILVFAEIPSVWTLAGSAIIIASTLYTMRRNALRRSGIGTQTGEN